MFTIISKLGGEEEVLKVLDRRLPKNTPRTPHALLNWRRTEAIPLRCAWVLRDEAQERGIDYDPADYKFQPRQHLDSPSSEPVEKVA